MTPTLRISLPWIVLSLLMQLGSGLARAQDQKTIASEPLVPAEAEPTPDASSLSSIAVQTLPESAKAKRAAPQEELSEIIVTAQKTQQSSVKVPISLTALSADFIKDVGAASLADISLYIPNARVDAHDLGSPQVFIRGFGTNAFNPAFESSVAFVQDDLYFGRPGYFTEPLFDVERVEVLRGPQGTLFGKNTIAGVFNVITKGVQGEPSANIESFAGTHNERRLEGGAGGMFTDQLGARVSFLYRDAGGETVNQLLGRKEDAVNQKAMRGKFVFLPIDTVNSELSLASSRTSAPFWPYQLFKLDSDTRTYLQGFDPNVEDDPKNFRLSFDTPGTIQKGSDTGSLKTEWDMGAPGDFSSLTSSLILGGSRFFIDQLNDLDVSPADIARLDSHEAHNQQSAELRFAGERAAIFGIGAGFEFVGGLYHYQSSYRLLANVLAGKDFGSYLLTNDAAQLASQGAVPSSTRALALPGLAQLRAVTAPLLTDGDYYQFNYGQKTQADAVFAQATWKLTESLAVVPGLRLGIETKHVDVGGHGYCRSKVSATPSMGSPCVIQTLLMASDYAANGLLRTEYDFSPKLAVQYFAESGINYYGSIAKASKSGGFNALALNTNHLEFQGEKATTYEAGAKAKFLENTLNINLGIYQTDFKNLQVLAFNGVAFDVGNAAAVSKGIEGDFQWLTAFRPLKLIGSFGLLDAHYTNYKDGPAPVSQGIGARQDLSGKRVAFAPRGTATLTPVFSFELLERYKLSVSGDVIYQGNQYTDTALDPNTYTASYTKYNARLMFSEIDAHWSVSIGGNNLADKRVLNQVINTIFFPGSYQAQQASGRQFFLQLNFKI